MSDVGYENLERRIPGLFWGRSWIAARAGGAAAWLLSEDGDRFFWQHPSREWLMHFFLRVPHAPGRNWEHRATVGQAIGRHVFHHVLALHGPEVAAAELVRRAEQLRFPVRCIPVRLQAPMQPDSWITIEPDLVQMSAFYAEGPTWILRVYNPQPASVTARIALPSSCLSAIYADFNLQGMEGEVSVEGRTLGVKLAPWQIATLLLRF
jgi:alpha-mannosidase